MCLVNNVDTLYVAGARERVLLFLLGGVVVYTKTSGIMRYPLYSQHPLSFTEIGFLYKQSLVCLRTETVAGTCKLY